MRRTTTQCVGLKQASKVADTIGPISQLMQYVQEEGAKFFRVPSNCSVLQWDYGTRIGTNLEFRATVAFMICGVPHHVAGVWMPSKKSAQRDAAERALGMYYGKPMREEPLLKRIENSPFSTPKAEQKRQQVENSPFSTPKVEQERYQVENSPLSTPKMGLKPRATCWADWTDLEFDPEDGMQTEVDELKNYCLKKGSPPPVWSYTFDAAGRCQAFVEIKLLGVAHTFSGQRCPDEGIAEVDVAKRVLWYLAVPGMEDRFELDVDYARSAAWKIPEPVTTSWVKDGGSEGEDRQAVKKTTIMRVQNRLQQLYARQLEAGTRVWRWQYERGRKDRQWPPRFRATVTVPLANWTVASDWIRGQREAQIDACEKLLELLGTQFPPVRSPTGSISS